MIKSLLTLTTCLFLLQPTDARAFSLNDLGGIDINKVLQYGQKAAKATRSFNEEERYYIGRASGARLLADHPSLNRTTLQPYVSAIGHTLAQASTRPEVYAGYHFIVLDDPWRVNAYAVPGGFIFITTGLVGRCNDEDELAGVLAHEISHLVLDHPIGSIKKQYVDQLTKDLLSEAGQYASADVKKLAELAGGLDNLSGMLVDHAAKGYSRSKEQDADSEAIAILQAAGYDPTAFPRVLARLSPVGTGNSGTHGNPEQRARYIEKRLSGLHPAHVRARDLRFNDAVRGM